MGLLGLIKGFQPKRDDGYEDTTGSKILSGLSGMLDGGVLGQGAAGQLGGGLLGLLGNVLRKKKPMGLTPEDDDDDSGMGSSFMGE